MKLKPSLNQAIGFVICLVVLFFISCKEEKKPLAIEKKQEARPNPFPFYKSIEIKPGYYFEVLSWGKGVDSLGGFTILMSDSLKNQYRSVSAERKGVVTDAWNMDMDNDGNPEVYIQYIMHNNMADLNVYELNSSGFEKIRFPGLSSEQKKYYAGNDRFYIKEGHLLRDVSLIKDEGGKQVTKMQTLQYQLSRNSFSGREVTETGKK